MYFSIWNSNRGLTYLLFQYDIAIQEVLCVYGIRNM